MRHVKETEDAPGEFSEPVLERRRLPGLSGRTALAGRLCLPKCGHKHGCRLSNGLYQCTHCHRQTSVTAGTVLHHSHVSLSKWFLAFYFVSQDKRGLSAVQLSNQIGVTYKTAWSMLRRIRSAMGQRDAAYLLSGVVEFDDAYFGRPNSGR